MFLGALRLTEATRLSIAWAQESDRLRPNSKNQNATKFSTPGEDRAMSMSTLRAAFAFTLAVAACSGPAFAQETLKLAVGQRTLFDTSISEVGQRGGIFKKHGLNLEIVYTQGSGETQQAVISESVDIGVAVGIMGALSAYSKSAPVR